MLVLQKMRDGIVLLPSRSSLYIERSRSPLTVNNCRLCTVTSGTCDSGSRAHLCSPGDSTQMRICVRTFIDDVTEEPCDRRKFLKDNARFEEQEHSGAARISGFVRDGGCAFCEKAFILLRPSLPPLLRVCRSIQNKLLKRMISLRNF